MQRLPTHAKGRVRAYVRLLKRCEAPQSLIDDFLDLVAIDEGIASEAEGSLETLDRLLLDACRKVNFPKPFEQGGSRAYFRPNQICSGHSDHRSDVPGWDDFCPKEEQAYRRGFDQGFSDALRYLEHKGKSSLKSRSLEIHKWRYARIWYGPSSPGTTEPFGIKVSIRSPISKKLRWSILQRDGRRCVVCGSSAADGVTLHVDHILSIYNGGTNDSENLQTLCESCNLGKGVY
jgi:hypothetical protein